MLPAVASNAGRYCSTMVGAERPELGPISLHVFSFGGLPKTLAWLDGLTAPRANAVV